MPITRSKYIKNLAVMSKTCLQDKRLSCKAKGLYAFIMSLQNHWEEKISSPEVELDDINKYFTDEEILLPGIRELIKFGYCEIINNKYIIHEIPLSTE